MCRLAYISKAFIGMQAWLNLMERSNGGDGSGVAIGDRVLKGYRMPATATGYEVTKRHTDARCRKKKIQPALWHTRLASSGDLCDDLCHPFPCADGWLVHNGHWHKMHEEARKAATSHRPMSDTSLFSEIVDGVGFSTAVLEMQPPGVWLHMLHDGRLSVWKRGGSLHFNPATGSWGSEAWCERWYEVKDGFYDYGDEPYLTLPKETYDDPPVETNWARDLASLERTYNRGHYRRTAR